MRNILLKEWRHKKITYLTNHTLKSVVSCCKCVSNNKPLCVFGLIIRAYYTPVLERRGCYLHYLWFSLSKQHQHYGAHQGYEWFLWLECMSPFILCTPQMRFGEQIRKYSNHVSEAFLNLEMSWIYRHGPASAKLLTFCKSTYV